MAFNWADGSPGALAKQFVATVGGPRSMSNKTYFRMVAAVGYASAYSIITAEPMHIIQKLGNVLATAKAISEAIRSKAQLEEDDEDSEDGMDVDDGLDDDTDPTSTLPASIQKLAAFINKLTQQQEQQTSGSAAVQGPTVTSPAEGDNGLLLPPVIVQQVMRCLDARRAAAAAACCKQLAAAHKMNRILDIPPSFQGYCMRLFEATVGDDWSDGSSEAAFTSKWPLDGSAIAGADLGSLASTMQIRSMMPVALPKDLIRAQPDAKSTPLAIFLNSKPVPLYSSRAATADPASSAPPKRSKPVDPDSEEVAKSRARLAAFLRGEADDFRAPADQPTVPPAPLPPTDVMTAACCNVSVLGCLRQGNPMDLAGDLLSYGFACGWKLCDPGLGAAVLKAGSPDGGDTDAGLDLSNTIYGHGLFDHVQRVCSDAGNALVWCAADSGRRIKAFAAPSELGGPQNVDAACNRLESNGMDLQYTFSTDVRGLVGQHAGLHVLGTKVFALSSTGALFTWDIAEMAPQTKVRHGFGGGEDVSDDEDEGGGSDGEPTFKGDIGWRDTEDPEELEVTVGVAPEAIYLLQRPKALQAFQRTTLLHSSSNSKTLVTSCAAYGLQDSIVVTYDLETQQTKNLFLGHLYSIEDIAPAPEAWPGAENLFASCARSGEVKIWDIRSRSGAAAITLTASDDALMAVVLAANKGCSPAGPSSSAGASSSNQLGAGMLCFAGGACEAVCAWDVRNGNAQALYQLSTGNLVVESLAWHEGSSSLIASCNSVCENRHGECYEDDFMKVGQRDTEGMRLLMSLMMPGLAVGNPLGGGGSDSGGDGDGGSSNGETRWWPRRAKHRSEDFKAHLNLAHSCVLAYTFSDKATQEVPESQEPYFHGSMW